MHDNFSNVIIFSCDTSFIFEISERLEHIGIRDAVCVGNAGQLSSALESASRAVIIFDTLYGSDEVCELIRDRIANSSLFCVCICERNDLEVFPRNNDNVVRLERPYTVNEFYMAFFHSSFELAARPAVGAAGLNANEQSVALEVTELLRSIGIPANVKGFIYLRSALCRTVCDTSLLRLITKNLYIGIAKEYDATPIGVERSIRHAIDIAWSHGSMQESHTPFSQYVSKRPTNSDFFSLATDYLRRRLGFEAGS